MLAVLTGRENAQLLGVLAGLTTASADVSIDGRRAESRLGAAFDRPVSSYSQGMRACVGFAVAQHLEPRILLHDEVQEALDHEFRNEVERVAERILSLGGIVVAAGHDHAMLARFSTRAVLTRGGRVERDGDFASVCAAYVGDP